MSNKKRISKFQKNKLKSDFFRKFSVKTSQHHVLGFNFITQFLDYSDIVNDYSDE